MGDYAVPNNHARTKLGEANGIIFDMRPDGTLKCRKHKMVLRVTKDDAGKSMSLCDELRGIMIEIPVEPVGELLKWMMEE